MVREKGKDKDPVREWGRFKRWWSWAYTVQFYTLNLPRFRSSTYGGPLWGIGWCEVSDLAADRIANPTYLPVALGDGLKNHTGACHPCPSVSLELHKGSQPRRVFIEYSVMQTGPWLVADTNGFLPMRRLATVITSCAALSER